VINLDEIKSFFLGRIMLHEPLSKYTSFRIGGPADYFLEPVDKNDVVRLIKYLQEHDVPFIIVGHGSNLLVSDDGIRGAIINLEYGLNNVQLEGNLIVAEAGVHLTRFVDFCIQQGRKGVEMLAGIPGTIGGAVIMNAGAYGGEISDGLKEVEIVREGHVITVKKEDAAFAYRRSGLNRDIVLAASFALPEGDKPELMHRRRELLIKRNQSQPLNLPSSGSVFKNPKGTFAAKLIEESGLKGTCRGKAQISEKHGNFIVNTGGAKASDVLELMRLAQSTVLKKFNVKLEPEVKLVGFAEEIYKELYN